MNLRTTWGVVDVAAGLFCCCFYLGLRGRGRRNENHALGFHAHSRAWAKRIASRYL